MLSLSRGITKTLQTVLKQSCSSHKWALVNTPPADYVENRPALKENVWRVPDPSHKRSYETHLSNGEELCHRVPVIYTDMNPVRCLGGVEIGPGHPQVYMQLNTRNPGQPVSCKYCGLRYALKHHH